jgi:branched-chain amino acid transport system ATP-binding protein
VTTTDPNVPVLELDHVFASYGTYRALFGVSLSVPAGGIVALLGSNGAGKSTVARVVSGLVPVTDGALRVDGEDVTRLPAHRIARLGVAQVPEGRGIFSTLSVEENLVLSFGKKLPKREVGAALERAYAGFAILGQRRRQQAGTLSGGQQRMLSLAKTLAVPPRLLVADELSLGLAPVVIDAVYEGLLAIRDHGCALLVVEQQIDRALSIADRAVLLAKGTVAWEGPSAEAEAAMDDVLAVGMDAVVTSVVEGTDLPATAGPLAE